MLEIRDKREYIQLAVYIEKYLHDKIRNIAKQNKISLSEVGRYLIKKALVVLEEK